MNFDEMTPVSAGAAERITDYWPGRADARTDGMTVVGEYIGSVTFDEGTDDEGTVHKLRKGEQIFGVSGGVVIERAFKDITVGSTVGVRFNGKKRSEKSGRMYNDFEVRVAARPDGVQAAEAVVGQSEMVPKDELETLPFN